MTTAATAMTSATSAHSNVTISRRRAGASEDSIQP